MPETAARTKSEHSLLATLDQVARLIEASGVGSVDPDERARAERLALALPGDAGGGENRLRLAIFVARLLGDIAVDLAADPPAALRLLDDLEQVAGLPVGTIGYELLRGSHLAQLPADVALQVQLTLLLIFTRARSLSLWVISEEEKALLVEQVGDAQHKAAGAEKTADRLLRSRQRRRWAHEGEFAGIVVDRGQLPAAAVIAQSSLRQPLETDLVLDAAAPMIGAILDRTQLLEAGAVDGPSVIAALERRLARLRYDLHDGPQQDVHLLALDLRLFRDQLTPIFSAHPEARRLLGRLDDLEAQLVALDSGMRDISTSMQSPFLPAGTLPEALQAITDAFASRAGVQPEVELSGDFTGLSDSQQITLLALVREGLSNVQKHSGAEKVTITIAAHSRGVDAQVSDDGCGFEPEETLVRAAREGHLGVVGIHERVRMLGGHARIESRPGGPTVISVSLPSWRAAVQAGVD
jgi:signal transduction histidine kinase